MSKNNRKNFDPAQEPPEGFQQELMREFFYSDMEAMEAHLEEVLKLLGDHKFIANENDTATARLCIEEALINSVKHGNKHDNSKKVQITLYSGKKSWAIRIEDEGEGFTEKDLPDYDDEDTLYMESGRGVQLINTFMDEVYYYDRGNRLLMIKHNSK